MDLNNVKDLEIDQLCPKSSPTKQTEQTKSEFAAHGKFGPQRGTDLKSIDSSYRTHPPKHTEHSSLRSARVVDLGHGVERKRGREWPKCTKFIDPRSQNR